MQRSRLNRAPYLGHVESLVQDHRPADAEDRDQKRRKPAGVIERREDGADFVLAQSPVERGVVAVPPELALRNHDAFGFAGGSGRVEEAVGFLGGCCWPVAGGCRLSVVGCLGFLAMPHRQLTTDNRQLARDVRKFIAGKQRSHFAISSDVFELIRRRARRERDDDHSRPARGEEELDELDAVVGEDAEAIARFEKRAQCFRGAVGAGVELGVGDALAGGEGDERRTLRRDAGALL